MCDCLKKMREALEKDERFNNPQLETSFMMNFESGKTIEKAGKLEFTYYKKKKDGTLQKRAEHSFVSFKHCPLCGVEY